VDSQIVIRVLVVDDSAAVRTMICGVLRREPDMEVVGTAADGREALKIVFTAQDDYGIVHARARFRRIETDEPRQLGEDDDVGHGE